MTRTFVHESPAALGHSWVMRAGRVSGTSKRRSRRFEPAHLRRPTWPLPPLRQPADPQRACSLGGPHVRVGPISDSGEAIHPGLPDARGIRDPLKLAAHSPGREAPLILRRSPNDAPLLEGHAGAAFRSLWRWLDGEVEGGAAGAGQDGDVPGGALGSMVLRSPLLTETRSRCPAATFQCVGHSFTSKS